MLSSLVANSGRRWCNRSGVCQNPESHKWHPGVLLMNKDEVFLSNDDAMKMHCRYWRRQMSQDSASLRWHGRRSIVQRRRLRVRQWLCWRGEVLRWPMRQSASQPPFFVQRIGPWNESVWILLYFRSVVETRQPGYNTKCSTGNFRPCAGPSSRWVMQGELPSSLQLPLNFEKFFDWIWKLKFFSLLVGPLQKVFPCRWALWSTTWRRVAWTGTTPEGLFAILCWSRIIYVRMWVSPDLISDVPCFIEKWRDWIYLVLTAWLFSICRPQKFLCFPLSHVLFQCAGPYSQQNGSQWEFFSQISFRLSNHNIVVATLARWNYHNRATIEHPDNNWWRKSTTTKPKHNNSNNNDNSDNNDHDPI